MSPARRQEIERLFHAALERPQSDRAAFLAEASQGDPELLRQVESMIAAGDTATLIVPGTQLGPYRIEARLGVGGMGEVFRAVDTRLGRPVAIKISHERYSDRFSREARVISSLNHPRICTLFDLARII
jgi:serine/threonine protein kinase